MLIVITGYHVKSINEADQLDLQIYSNKNHYNPFFDRSNSTKFLMKYNLVCFQICGRPIMFVPKYDYQISTSFNKENKLKIDVTKN